MSTTRTAAVLAVVGLVVLGGAGVVSAHDWQTTVTQGPMELGISSTPETPKAGMQTEFSASITDNDPEGDANRTSWGGVTNAEIEVHIRGPDGYHDHVTTHIPEDDSHFHFSYVFPEAGNYSIALVTELEGEEYAFQFTKQVTLLPARATGPEMAHLSEDIHAVSEDVETVNENVQAVNESVGDVHGDVESVDAKVETLTGQVEDLQSQVQTLQSSLEDAEEPQANAGQPSMALYGMLLLVGIGVGGGAVFLGRFN